MFHQFIRLRDNDKREGMVPNDFWDSMPEDKSLRENAEENLSKLLFFTYANCWNMDERENALMWKAYAPGGVAIQTTVGKLMDAKLARVMSTDSKGNGWPKIEQCTIEYADSWAELKEKGYRHNDIPLNFLFLHLKRKAFRGEAEVRFRIQSPENFPVQANGSFITPKPEDAPHWCPVTFKTLDWIDQVVTAPSTSEWATKPIQRAAEKKRVRFSASGI